MDVKWIKITTNMFDDEKIKLIESMPDKDAILIIWIKLLVLAGRINASGYLYLAQNIPYTDEMLSTILNRPLNTIRLALDTFTRFGMISITEGHISISNWEKHQNVEGLEKIKEQTRARVAKHRTKQKLLPDSVTLPVTLRNATEVEVDKKEEVDKNNKDICASKLHTPKFIPPTVEEVKSYCLKRNNNIDADKFVAFYESKGWMIGKNKMKSWKSSVITWERSDTTVKPKYEEYKG